MARKLLVEEGCGYMTVARLPDDWNEADMELRERLCDSSNSNRDPRVVKSAVEWATRVLPDAVWTMTLEDIVDYWYEFYES